MAKSSKPKPEPSSPRHTAFEAFELVTVHRSQLNNAPYNPRVITDHQKRKLKASLKKNKRLAPEVWNCRTGNLVGGHQRISILDDLEGTKDYTLTVAKVDLTDAQERAANVALNNDAAMGGYDFAKLEEVLRDSAVDLEATGFDVGDVYRMFGDNAIAERPADEIQQLADQTREAAKHYDSIRDDNRKRNESEFYFVVVFGSDADRDDFIETLGLPNHRFQDGKELRELFQMRQFGDVEGDGDGDAGESDDQSANGESVNS